MLRNAAPPVGTLEGSGGIGPVEILLCIVAALVVVAAVLIVRAHRKQTFYPPAPEKHDSLRPEEIKNEPNETEEP